MKSTPSIVSRIASATVAYAAVVMVLLVGTVGARADKAGKQVANKPTTVSPIGSAVNATLNAVERSSVRMAANGVRIQRVQNGADTGRRENRIVSVRATTDIITIRVELTDDDPAFDLGLYNMLGKKVMDVYHGPAFKGSHEYSTQISDLPEGVYICIAQGDGFRKAEKFFRSR